MSTRLVVRAAHRSRDAVARCWRDLAGIASLVTMALAYLSPALKDGFSFGGFDFVVPLTSLGAGLYPSSPHNRLNSDVISQMNAWNGFDWRQIHAGTFPLWNDLTLTGMPQFFNFESATLSLPDIASYAAPLRAAFLVAVLVKLLIAGTGVYVFARVVGLRAIASAFAGITFMLSGGFEAWLSWPLSDVVSWLGWIAAFAVLAYRWRSRLRFVVGLAVSVAFSVYGGFPEANAFLALALSLLALSALVVLLCRHRRLSLGGLGRVVGGTVAGVLLSAPLWLPGLQLIHLAHRSTEGGFPGIPARALSLLVVPGYDGLPTKGSTFLLHGWNYYETVSYVGVVALALALVAVVRWWRHPVVMACLVTALSCVLVSYQTHSFHVVQDFLNHHGLASIEWLRYRSLIGFPLGILAGTGLETLLAPRTSRGPLRAFLAAAVLLAGALAVLFVTASSGLASPRLLGLREQSLWWPAGLVVACLACWALLLLAGGARHWRRSRALSGAAVAALFSANAAFLLFSGVGINSYSKAYFPVSAAIARLQATVGDGLVGLDTGVADVQSFTPLGFYPEVNLGYRIAEFAGHDPLLPQAYFSAVSPGGAKGGPGFIEPDISTVSAARRFGVQWLLVRSGLEAPPKAVLVATLAGERLFAVPGSRRFSFAPGVPDKVLSVRHLATSEYDLSLAAPAAGALELRVTDVPGWHATLDGRAVTLSSFDGVMMSLEVPAGAHSLRLWYMPGRFLEGIAGAAAAVVALLGLFGFAAVRRRRRGASSAGSGAGASGVPERFDDGLSLAGELREVRKEAMRDRRIMGIE